MVYSRRVILLIDDDETFSMEIEMRPDGKDIFTNSMG